ncbi:uncharacterized protein PAC_11111 [Phialocephala subalpina]|uniref:Uncharacterized protein n=1 Tax=Phialocephala subalpina TaxID=576137 RepID=A0A1L7X863_9HELO|nr:uncharacterized protein PAC_11111 [Phialocephala subalpina]
MTAICCLSCSYTGDISQKNLCWSTLRLGAIYIGSWGYDYPSGYIYKSLATVLTTPLSGVVDYMALIWRNADLSLTASTRATIPPSITSPTSTPQMYITTSIKSSLTPSSSSSNSTSAKNTASFSPTTKVTLGVSLLLFRVLLLTALAYFISCHRRKHQKPKSTVPTYPELDEKPSARVENGEPAEPTELDSPQASSPWVMEKGVKLDSRVLEQGDNALKLKGAEKLVATNYDNRGLSTDRIELEATGFGNADQGRGVEAAGNVPGGKRKGKNFAQASAAVEDTPIAHTENAGKAEDIAALKDELESVRERKRVLNALRTAHEENELLLQKRLEATILRKAERQHDP